MKMTTLQELISRGYAEDAVAGRAFERPYIWPNLILAVIFFVSLGLVFAKGAQMQTGLPVMAVCFMIICTMILRLRLSTPRSRHTGKPMERFRNSSPEGDVLSELIYVCHDSKTFFRRVYAVHATDGG